MLLGEKRREEGGARPYFAKAYEIAQSTVELGQPGSWVKSEEGQKDFG